MKYRYGNIAWVEPGYAGQDPDDWSDPPYIEHRFPLTSAFNMAEALWRMGGHPERAELISDILSRSIERCEAIREFHPWVLNDADLDKLIPLMSGFEASLSSAGLEEGFRIPTARLPEFRQKYPEIDLEPEGAIIPRYLGSTLAHADSLKAFLRGARERGLHVYFDFER